MKLTIFRGTKEKDETWNDGNGHNNCNDCTIVSRENCIFSWCCIAAVQNFTVVFHCRRTFSYKILPSSNSLIFAEF